MDNAVLTEEIAGYKIIESYAVRHGIERFRAEKDGKQYFVKKYCEPFNMSQQVRLEKLKTIRSSNVSRVIEYGEDYEVQNFYNGHSLDKCSFSAEEIASDVVPKINKALSDIHSINLMHGDICPENVILCDGMYILTDFDMSQNGDYISGYTAPEVIENGYRTASSDYFSFGMLLYKMYTGINPYGEMTIEERCKYTGIATEEGDLFPFQLYLLISGLSHDSSSRYNSQGVHTWCKLMENKNFVMEPPKYDGTIGSVSFNGRTYSLSEQNEFMNDLISDWDNGLEFLLQEDARRILTAYSPKIGSAHGRIHWCREKELVKMFPNANHLSFLGFIRNIEFAAKVIYFKNLHYNSLQELASSVITQSVDELKKGYYPPFLNDYMYVALSYAEKTGELSSEQIEKMKRIEASRKEITLPADDATDEQREEWSLSTSSLEIALLYVIKGSKALDLPGGTVKNEAELRELFKKLIENGDSTVMEAFLDSLCDKNGTPNLLAKIWCRVPDIESL